MIRKTLNILAKDIFTFFFAEKGAILSLELRIQIFQKCWILIVPVNRKEDWSATPAWEILLILWDESYSTSGMAPDWLPLSRHPEEKRHRPARTGSGLPRGGAEGHGGGPGGRRRPAPLLNCAVLPRSRYLNWRFQSAYYADAVRVRECSRSGAGSGSVRFWAFRIRVFPSTIKKIKKNLDFIDFNCVSFKETCYLWRFMLVHKVISKKKLSFVSILKATDEKSRIRRRIWSRRQ